MDLVPSHSCSKINMGIVKDPKYLKLNVDLEGTTTKTTT
jgi:hypothetical protein